MGFPRSSIDTLFLFLYSCHEIIGTRAYLVVALSIFKVLYIVRWISWFDVSLTFCIVRVQAQPQGS